MGIRSNATYRNFARTSKVKTDGRFREMMEIVLGMAALALFVFACGVVLRPFLAAITWAAILCYSTWPIYSPLERLLKGRRTLTATLMTFIVTLFIIVPVILLGASLLDNMKHFISFIRNVYLNGAPELPPWVQKIPILGPPVSAYWKEISKDGTTLIQSIKEFFIRWKGWFVQWGFNLGHGMLQLFLSVFISFFFYRDGVWVLEKAQAAGRRIVGSRTQHLFNVAGSTIKGVMYGILGTALIHAILAGLGFWVVGLPLPLLWALLIFFLSLVPGATLLIWAPACLLLYKNGSLGGAVGLAIWAMIITLLDHVIKPILISRGTHLPFVLVLFGAVGGVLAFGLIGLFVGPTLLALGFSLTKDWLMQRTGSSGSPTNA